MTTKKIDAKSVKIRRMVYDDIDSVIAIWWANVPTREIIASQLGSPMCVSYIAEIEGHLVGFILARITYLGLPMTRVGLINFIAVKPEYQEHGIGVMLLDTLKNHCKEQGISTMRAIVLADDTHIIRYFEKNGFNTSTTIIYDKQV
jgi:ribosomal protein S18 acetylase RimI-like enzyme